MDIHNNYPQTSFTARCAPIRDSQWVCHIINTTFPHISTSKLKPVITKHLLKTFPDKVRETPQKLNDTYEILNRLELSKEDISNNKFYSFGQKLIRKIELMLLPAQTKAEYKRLHYCKNLIKKFGDLRNLYDRIEINEINKTLSILETHKMGNCLEAATLSEFVLRLNGIENATTAFLIHSKTYQQIDHAVCAFNIDGSKFDGNITNKTIIIDPWAGIADFAKNIKKIYKNTMQDAFDITDHTDIKFEPIQRVYLSNIDFDIKKSQYPQLIFKNKHRKFMQK